MVRLLDAGSGSTLPHPGGQHFPRPPMLKMGKTVTRICGRNGLPQPHSPPDSADGVPCTSLPKPAGLSIPPKKTIGSLRPVSSLNFGSFEYQDSLENCSNVTLQWLTLGQQKCLVGSMKLPILPVATEAASRNRIMRGQIQSSSRGQNYLTHSRPRGLK